MTTDTVAVVIDTRISDERYESLLVLLGPRGQFRDFGQYETGLAVT